MNKNTCHLCMTMKHDSEGEWHWINDFMRWLCHSCWHTNKEAKA